MMVDGKWLNIEDGHNHLVQADSAYKSMEHAYRCYCFYSQREGQVPQEKKNLSFIKVKGVNAYRIVEDSN